MNQKNFYKDTLVQLLNQGVLRKDHRILVVCGGEVDRKNLLSAGFEQVTISNLERRMAGDEFEPYEWSLQDCENLSFADNEFDFVMVHSGLHHCYSPHRALVEMLRVGRLGVVGFEPHDSLVTRIGAKLGFGQEYEDDSVFSHNLEFGGVANSKIPNFVYRFSAHEISKVAHCSQPHGRSECHFIYGTRVNWVRMARLKNPLFRLGLKLARPLFDLLGTTRCFANNIAFAIEKPTAPVALHPWIESTSSGELSLKEDWFVEKYGHSTLAEMKAEEEKVA